MTLLSSLECYRVPASGLPPPRLDRRLDAGENLLCAGGVQRVKPGEGSTFSIYLPVWA